MRQDLRELRLTDELITELRMLTAHRGDIAAERTRTINRLRGRLLGIFPALERALDVTNRGPLVLVSQFQTPSALSAIGQRELEQWLRERKVRPADKLAAVAITAARGQQTRVAGEALAAQLIARLATAVLDLDRQIADLDKMISERFKTHDRAQVITSMVGIGEVLGAEFLAATVAPSNLHRPKRYNRQLQRVFYTSALISIQRSAASKAYYDRKRAEGEAARASRALPRSSTRQRPLGTAPGQQPL
jgi:hypothetical protein